MSFNCELCGYQNNEIQSGGQVQDQGIKFKVKIQSSEDLCRQIVKSDYATLTVPEIELEIPPNSQKGGKKKYDFSFENPLLTMVIFSNDIFNEN